MTQTIPDNPPETDGDETGFTRALEALRPALRGYILSIFPHPHLCEDIVQETILFAWMRRDEFTSGTNLRAWVFKTAYFKTLASRRDAKREVVVTFSEEMLHKIARKSEAISEEADHRLLALQECLSALKPDELDLIRLKYVEGGSLTKQAQLQNVAPNRLQKAISRLRLSLRHCIENRTSNPS